MTEKATSGALEQRLRATQEQLDTLAEKERAVNAKIGTTLAAGGDVGALRAERAEVRESLEDLTSLLPVLERQLAEARKGDTRTEFARWLETEQAQVTRAGEIGKELRPHLDGICQLVPELAALVAEHDTMTRRKIKHLAEAAGERQPARPNLVATATLSPKLLDTTLAGLVHEVQQLRALHPELLEVAR